MSAKEQLSEDSAQEEESSAEKSAGSASSGGRGSRSKNASNGKELLTELVPARAKKAPAKLREHLTGVTVICLKGESEAYVLNWSGPELEVTITENVEKSDCTITLSENDLMEI